MKTHIKNLHARQILDSRGRPTVEVDLELRDGSMGRASVPSGASTGAAEAHELRDRNPKHYRGLGVLTAVSHINLEIAGVLTGKDANDQQALDQQLCELDGTPQLERLGANAVLAVSLSACRAAAQSSGQNLYQRIAELCGQKEMRMPMPMVNILSGGVHAGRGMDTQDFLAVPVSARDTSEALHMVERVRHAAAEIMQERGMSTLLADEGGLSPGFARATQALQLMVRATEQAGLRPGEDIAIAVDVAASALKGPNGQYKLTREGRLINGREMIDRVSAWVTQFPVISVEDAIDENAWDDWATLNAELGHGTQLVGDDLFATNLARLQKGIELSAANCVLIKLNQNGTLSGTLQVFNLARRNGYAAVVSARSGETEDAFLADLAVGTGAGQIKVGSLRSSERLSKYNQLLRIEELASLPFAGMAGFAAQR